jgi:hypothetical protein
MPPDPAALPAPPDRPDPLECCGRGCCPCIFDYYDDALERWRTLVTARGGDPNEMLKALGRPPGG